MAPRTSARILVMDDEPSIVRALARLLHREGHTVDTAGNGRQALVLLHAHDYDVLLADLRMPELDGQAFYACLRQQYPALRQRVIFLTAVSEEAESQAFLTQCGQPWLRKPYPITALRSVIQQVLRSAPPAVSAPCLARDGSRL
jgi:two-component system response regulator GlrR